MDDSSSLDRSSDDIGWSRAGDPNGLASIDVLALSIADPLAFVADPLAIIAAAHILGLATADLLSSTDPLSSAHWLALSTTDHLASCGNDSTLSGWDTGASVYLLASRDFSLWWVLSQWASTCLVSISTNSWRLSCLNFSHILNWLRNGLELLLLILNWLDDLVASSVRVLSLIESTALKSTVDVRGSHNVVGKSLTSSTVWSSLYSSSSWNSWNSLSLEFGWGSRLLDNSRRLADSSVDIASNGADLLSSLKVSSNNSIGLDKGIQFLLQVLVLLSQKSGVLLESFQFSFEFNTSIHQSLVGEDNRLKIRVETSLINLKGVIFGFKILELSGILVRTVVFITVLLELDFLFFD